ncbi:hypothetical protein CGC20_25465 [Leishmania donovani]|uniref:Uncharacterized protein n=1 Tax=Leishmania donovani TaxID=5661 RepID=A0A504XXM8_LEIDO|nr:hypothetical protein CGC20_25465 [Leishmania donovani]
MRLAEEDIRVEEYVLGRNSDRNASGMRQGEAHDTQSAESRAYWSFGFLQQERDLIRSGTDARGPHFLSFDAPDVSRAASLVSPSGAAARTVLPLSTSLSHLQRQPSSPPSLGPQSGAAVATPALSAHPLRLNISADICSKNSRASNSRHFTLSSLSVSKVNDTSHIERADSASSVEGLCNAGGFDLAQTSSRRHSSHQALQRQPDCRDKHASSRPTRWMTSEEGEASLASPVQKPAYNGSAAPSVAVSLSRPLATAAVARNDRSVTSSDTEALWPSARTAGAYSPPQSSNASVASFYSHFFSSAERGGRRSTSRSTSMRREGRVHEAEATATGSGGTTALSHAAPAVAVAGAAGRAALDARGHPVVRRGDDVNAGAVWTTSDRPQRATRAVSEKSPSADRAPSRAAASSSLDLERHTLPVESSPLLSTAVLAVTASKASPAPFSSRTLRFSPPSAAAAVVAGEARVMGASSSQSSTHKSESANVHCRDVSHTSASSSRASGLASASIAMAAKADACLAEAPPTPPDGLSRPEAANTAVLSATRQFRGRAGADADGGQRKALSGPAARLGPGEKIVHGFRGRRHAAPQSKAIDATEEPPTAVSGMEDNGSRRISTESAQRSGCGYSSPANGHAAVYVTGPASKLEAEEVGHGEATAAAAEAPEHSRPSPLVLSHAAVTSMGRSEEGRGSYRSRSGSGVRASDAGGEGFDNESRTNGTTARQPRRYHGGSEPTTRHRVTAGPATCHTPFDSLHSAGVDFDWVANDHASQQRLQRYTGDEGPLAVPSSIDTAVTGPPSALAALAVCEGPVRRGRVMTSQTPAAPLPTCGAVGAEDLDQSDPTLSVRRADSSTSRFEVLLCTSSNSQTRYQTPPHSPYTPELGSSLTNRAGIPCMDSFASLEHTPLTRSVTSASAMEGSATECDAPVMSTFFADDHVADAIPAAAAARQVTGGRDKDIADDVPATQGLVLGVDEKAKVHALPHYVESDSGPVPRSSVEWPSSLGSRNPDQPSRITQPAARTSGDVGAEAAHPTPPTSSGTRNVVAACAHPSASASRGAREAYTGPSTDLGTSEEPGNSDDDGLEDSLDDAPTLWDRHAPYPAPALSIDGGDVYSSVSSAVVFLDSFDQRGLVGDDLIAAPTQEEEHESDDVPAAYTQRLQQWQQAQNNDVQPQALYRALRSDFFASRSCPRWGSESTQPYDAEGCHSRGDMLDGLEREPNTLMNGGGGGGEDHGDFAASAPSSLPSREGSMQANALIGSAAAELPSWQRMRLSFAVVPSKPPIDSGANRPLGTDGLHRSSAFPFSDGNSAVVSQAAGIYPGRQRAMAAAEADSFGADADEDEDEDGGYCSYGCESDLIYV